jgi:hypothetical protein
MQAVKEAAAERIDTQKNARKWAADSTDPEARKMKMADGGFWPAYNVQIATVSVRGAEGPAGSDVGCIECILLSVIRRSELIGQTAPPVGATSPG